MDVIIDATKKVTGDYMSLRRHRHICMHHEDFRRHYEEFRKYHKRVKYLRPGILLFNLAVLYFLYRYLGLKTISLFFAVLISVKGVWEIFFLMRLEKRIFKPIEQLKNGVDEIARGNYDVQIKHDDSYMLNMLIDSFNDMAQKLHAGERVQAEYEENRRMLIANISHDLKTPVTSIQGYIEAVLESTAMPPETLQKYLQTIYSNSVYINKLIDDLFLFTKLDMQKLDFTFEQLPVKAFMADLMEEFRFELAEKDCAFEYTDKLAEDCYLNIDRKRLQQAMRNIIGNALKYGPAGEVSVRVEMSGQDGFVCIGISDNGPGIPADKLPHIFDRFYRIDYERTKDLMSTGLGLAIAKELVEAHAGRIEAASVEGEGTCFTIMLPI